MPPSWIEESQLRLPRKKPINRGRKIIPEKDPPSGLTEDLKKETRAERKARVEIIKGKADSGKKIRRNTAVN